MSLFSVLHGGGGEQEEDTQPSCHHPVFITCEEGRIKKVVLGEGGNRKEVPRHSPL